MAIDGIRLREVPFPAGNYSNLIVTGPKPCYYHGNWPWNGCIHMVEASMSGKRLKHHS